LAKREFIPGKTRIPLIIPTYGPTEVEEALDSLLSTWVSMGEKVKRFEESFAQYLGCRYAVMVNSGSSANLLALSVLTNPSLKNGIKPGSEIITPAVTWVTTVYPIQNVGCVPVLVDVDLETFNVLPEAIERAMSRKTRGIMPVHLLGAPCRIDKVNQIAEKQDLFVIEDSCESTGAEFHGKKVGTFGDMGTFSFFMSHHISTIEGGMVVTDDERLYELLKAMRAFGWIRDMKESKRYSHEYPRIDPRFLFVTSGYNLRPTEIQGAFGIHQIRKLDRFIEIRRRNASYWNARLRHYRDVLVLPEEQSDSRCVYFGYPLTLRPKARFSREEIVSYLEKKRIETRPIMAGNFAEQPVSKQIHFRISGPLSNSQTIMRCSFFMGNHSGIGSAQREYVADCIVDFLDRSVRR
jgi:dTDP-4-amino-4,6-dideoxygalactose transaminase